MLRHEQVGLAAPVAGEPAVEVQAVEFRGPVSTLALTLSDSSPVHLTVPSAGAPEAGARVRLVVVGPAHVLPAT
jgi:hypothetical protein